MTRSSVTLCLAFLALVLRPDGSSGQEPFRSRCGAGVHLGEERGIVALPQGSIFCPLVADPKSEHSFASYLRGDFATIANPGSDPNINLAAVGLGDSFGLLRIASGRPGDGLQLDLAAGIFAQFNLDEPSFDLINADYVVGLPITFRYRGYTTRLRLYHQSSHLGDEFLLSREPERENLSFESLELIVSQESGPLRVYLSGESFFSRNPITIESQLAHVGIELRPSAAAGRLLAALDIKAIEEVDWKTAVSARAGIEIARVPSPGHPPRVVSILAEYYSGPAPYGQFYRDDIRYFGVGLHFSSP